MNGNGGLTVGRVVSLVNKRIALLKKGATATVEEMWPDLKTQLSEKARDHFIKLGIASSVNSDLHESRYIVASSEPTKTMTMNVVVTESQPKNIFFNLIYSVKQEAKRFGEFTRQDCEEVAKTMRRDANGKMRVAAFMDATAAYLEKAKVSRVDALPSFIKKKLEKDWPLQ